MSRASFGLFLNCGGEVPGRTHAAVFDIALAEAELAERLGYRDLSVTESVERFAKEVAPAIGEAS